MLPDQPAEDIFHTGNMHLTQGRKPEALFCYDQTLLRKPDHWQAWANRGGVLHTIGNYFDSVLNLNKSLDIRPNVPETLMTRGQSFVELGLINNAIDDFHKVLDLNPRFKEAYIQLGNVLQLSSDTAGAMDCYQKAFDIDPACTEAELYLSMMQLELGLLRDGWDHFEVRWRVGQLPLRDFSCKLWRGEDLDGKKILIYGEQGLGDMVQFIRYATVVREQHPNAFIVVETRRTLQRLATTVPGVDEVVIYGDPHGNYDYAVPMMSLPRLCGTNTLDDVPAWGRYMKPPEHRVNFWQRNIEKERAVCRQRGLSAANGMLVGICWSGAARPLMPLANAVDQKRSTHLNQWEPLAKIPDILFVSLQTGTPSDQCISPPPPMTISNNKDEFEDFADTAALMECLDLVISVDTAVAHVAAAIGRPTWLLSRFDGCWRWHGARKDSPWYPTLRQFRQPQPKNWSPMFQEVADELRRFVAHDQMKEAAE